MVAELKGLTLRFNEITFRTYMSDATRNDAKTLHYATWSMLHRKLKLICRVVYQLLSSKIMQGIFQVYPQFFPMLRRWSHGYFDVSRLYFRRVAIDLARLLVIQETRLQTELPSRDPSKSSLPSTSNEACLITKHTNLTDYLQTRLGTEESSSKDPEPRIQTEKLESSATLSFFNGSGSGEGSDRLAWTKKDILRDTPPYCASNDTLHTTR
jgi:hypothetical protein